MNDLYFLSLKGGGFAVIDAHNAQRVNEESNKWYLDRDGYVRHDYSIFSKKGRRVGAVFLHRFINRTPAGFETHHVNHCVIDNTERNLRAVTGSQNSHNKVKKVGTSSTYIGVDFIARLRKNPWRAAIMQNGKAIHLGCFPTEVEAAKAYNDAAIKLFGDFANLNVLPNG